MSAFVDTNILVRHLTGDPPDMAARATAYLRSEDELLITDLVAAATVDVLESFYEAPPHQVAEAVRSLIAFDSVVASTQRCCCGLQSSMRRIGSTSATRTWSPAPRAPMSAGSRPSTGSWTGSAASKGLNRPQSELVSVTSTRRP